MRDTPKRIKRLLREYAGEAHEEELRRALLPLAERFRQWERAEFPSGELTELIHRFHQGPARELWKRYNGPDLDLVVAHAIAAGILDRGTMPADVLDHLAGPLGLYEEIGRAPAGGSPAGQDREAYRFRVSLLEVVPPVWRTIEVPSTYTFWDLHVAIQDAMGWRDHHLHAFRVASPATGGLVEIGIPNDDPFEGEPPVTPGWEVPIASHFTAPMAEARYEYDFGDSWEHLVVLEAVTRVATDTRLPRCTGGARACPPEDCGGPWGYERLLSIIGDPDHEEHDEMLVWLGGSFDPDRFDPAQVAFDDPRRRWRIAFEDAPEPVPPARRRPGRRRPRRP